MILSTTSNLEGHQVENYLGIVSGETIIGANIFKDFFASITDIVGGRSSAYEQVLREAKATAMSEMEMQARQLGANAIIGIDLDYETIRGHADGYRKWNSSEGLQALNKLDAELTGSTSTASSSH
jgi:uncharacterized protein YbjQ (UPF0145 family)